jgi:hypothetical protein
VADHTAGRIDDPELLELLGQDPFRQQWLREYGEILGHPNVPVSLPPGWDVLGTPFQETGLNFEVPGSPEGWELFIETSNPWQRMFLEGRLLQISPECIDAHRRLRLQALPDDALSKLDMESLHEHGFHLAKRIVAARREHLAPPVAELRRFQLVVDCMARIPDIVDRDPLHPERPADRLLDEIAEAIMQVREPPEDQRSAPVSTPPLRPSRVLWHGLTAEQWRVHRQHHRDALIDECTRRKVAEVRTAILDTAEARKWPPWSFEKLDPSTSRRVLVGEVIGGNRRAAWEAYVLRDEKRLERLEHVRTELEQRPGVGQPRATTPSRRADGSRIKRDSAWRTRMKAVTARMTSSGENIEQAWKALGFPERDPRTLRNYKRWWHESGPGDN